MGESEQLSRAVAQAWFRLLSYKDEYEVARLYTDGAFEAELRRQFEARGYIEVETPVLQPIYGAPLPPPL